jgi:hypothetical protein
MQQGSALLDRPIKRWQELLLIIRLLGGEKRCRGLIKKARTEGYRVPAAQLEWILIELSARRARRRTRNRPSPRAEEDWWLLHQADQSARSAPSGETAHEIIRRAVLEATAKYEAYKTAYDRGELHPDFGSPIRPTGSTTEQITRRLYARIRPPSGAPPEFPWDTFTHLLRRVPGLCGHLRGWNDDKESNQMCSRQGLQTCATP